MLNQFQLFDSHLHIIDRKFPLTENQGYTPAEFTCADYLARISQYRSCGGAIVSGSFQAYDQSYLLDAMHTLGNSFVGVSQLPHTVANEEIARLDALGVRAVRFNLKRGGSESIMHLPAMANRVFDIAKWHVELYIDSADLEELYPIILKLPRVSIDHLGLNSTHRLLRLVEKGVKVKASGFGRVNIDVTQALKEIYSVNPLALMFGTDLPSTRAPRAYSDQDFVLVAENLDAIAAKRIFSENAVAFYRPKRSK